MRGRGVKKTAISQAKSCIASEHTKNTCDMTYAAPLKIKRQRERRRQARGEREEGTKEVGGEGAESTRPKVPTRDSFRLTAYLIKTTLSRPACAENDAVHGPCSKQNETRKSCGQERQWMVGRRAVAKRLLNLYCNCCCVAAAAAAVAVAVAVAASALRQRHRKTAPLIKLTPINWRIL